MSDVAARLAIRLFGAPEVRVADSPLILNHQKARALLYYLAATGHAHTREHLATLLWSESSESDARHSLRSNLYRLRQALRLVGVEETLAGEGELISLRSAEYECDVIRFRELIAEHTESALREAVAWHRGPFLAGFTLADAPLFEEWVRFEETALNRTYLEALDRLAAWAESRQAWSEAIGYVQRIVQLDPLSEDAQRRLIQLYLQNESPGLALRQYQQLEAVLKQDLGVQPTAETQALIDEALRHRASFVPSVEIRLDLAARPSHTLPFVGREDLLARLTVLSRDPIAQRGMTVLLQGEAGVGKTRLVDELADRLLAESPHWLILRGACSPFDDLLSYGPFLEAFQSAAAGDLTGLLTEPHATDPQARGRFFYQILQALRALTRNHLLLLAIDDLQWANSSTLNLFGFLATRLRNVPVLLVGTVQNSESIPALQRLITLGRRHGDLQLLTLTALPLESVSALLRAAGLSSTSIATLAEWLHERSGGSPFVLGEILSQLRSEEILIWGHDGWRLEVGRWLRWRAAFTLPETTHDLVAWRLANLTSGARCVLDVLAVAGQPVPFTLLQDFPDLHSDPLAATLDDLADRRLVVETDRETYALPHHLLRETLLRRLSHIRQRLLHRQLAEAWEAQLTDQADLPLRRIALHAVAGEDVERARRYGLQVLQDLPQDYRAAETAGFFQQLYDLLAPTAAREELLRLTHALGELHYSLGHIEAAAHWYEQHLEIARAANDRAAQAATYFDMSELALVTGDHVGAVTRAEAGLEVCNTAESAALSAQVGRGQRLLGAALAMEGHDLLSAEDHLQQALAVQRQTNQHGDLCATLFEIGNVAAQRGELRRALDSYSEAAQQAKLGHVYYYLALAHNNLAYHSLLLGQLEAARRYADLGVKLAESYEMLGVLLYLYSTQGEIHLYQAEWAAATEMFQRGLSLAEELNHLERQAGYRAGLALAACGLNDLDRAVALFEEGLALIAGQGYWHLRARIQIWLAETLLAREQIMAAQPHLEAASATARQHGRILLLIQAERVRARLFAANGDWPGANALFAEIARQTQELDLVIELARTQAAWGEAMLRYSPVPDQADPLLAEARSTFAAYHARADLESLPHSLTV